MNLVNLFTKNNFSVSECIYLYKIYLRHKKLNENLIDDFFETLTLVESQTMFQSEYRFLMLQEFNEVVLPTLKTLYEFNYILQDNVYLYKTIKNE